MRQRRWCLPEAPDVLAMIRGQAAIAVEGMHALQAWTEGDADAAERLRDAEHRADERKRELWRALRDAFTTPVDPEDLFALSSELDSVLNRAKDVVREAEVLGVGTGDEGMVEMVARAAEGVTHLAVALGALGDDDDAATAAADAAVKSQRQIERVYRRAMPALTDGEDLRAVIGRIELYRRLVAIGEGVIRVADRVWYAVVKEA